MAVEDSPAALSDAELVSASATGLATDIQITGADIQITAVSTTSVRAPDTFRDQATIGVAADSTAAVVLSDEATVVVAIKLTDVTI